MKISSSRVQDQFETSLISGNIIYSKLNGSFSAKGSQDYTTSVKRLVQSLAGDKFAILVNNLALEGGTPEAYDILEQYNLWLNQQAIVAKAFIINDNVTKQIMLTRSPSLEKQNIEFFKTIEQAKQWLTEQLAKSEEI